MNAPHVRVYDSLGSDYEQAFATFLRHTDQKEQARYWLDQIVKRLPNRRVFVDAGAGTGVVTNWYAEQFEKTIAIEPNPHLRRQLGANCPRATILDQPIMSARPGMPADFVLNSHVFYYIPEADWNTHLDRLASFAAPGGVVVVILQNSGSDCMRLLQHFHKRRFDLPGLGDSFQKRHAAEFHSQIITAECHVQTADLPTAYTVAEFMLNLLPVRSPPLRCELEDFVDNEFADEQGGFRFSCTQDFLVIRRAAS